jgi:hypothetical protein
MVILPKPEPITEEVTLVPTEEQNSVCLREESGFLHPFLGLAKFLPISSEIK